MERWIVWGLVILGVWAIWNVYRVLKRAKLEAPLREAARTADDLIRRGDVAEMAAVYRAGDPISRLGAALALAGVESDAAMEPLIAAMDDENLEIRLIAAKALAKIGHEDALNALVEKGLRDPSTLVRTSVLRSLGQRGDAEVVPAVAKALKQALSDPELRARELEVGANALALLGDNRGMWVLKDAQECDVKRVCEAATQAQAILELRARLERDPQDADAARELGARYIAATEFVRARAALTRAIELDPTDPSARRALGAVHAELDETDLALEQYQEAAKLIPDDPRIQAALGDALLRADRPDEARQAYERALQLQPDGPQAKRVRKALRKVP